MLVILRIQQRFSVRHEQEFLELERRFIELEKNDPRYPQGRRSRPLAGSLPVHTLIWEAEFPSLEAAREALRFMGADPAHEELLARQVPFIEDVKIEYYETFP